VNLLSWQKIEKIQFEFCKDETFLLQFFLENNGLRGFFIQNGEFAISLDMKHPNRN